MRFDRVQWSLAEGKWSKIGDVVDAVGEKRKQLHEGQEYDYVFDVDIGEGMPALKLPYNVTGRLADASSCRGVAD